MKTLISSIVPWLRPDVEILYAATVLPLHCPRAAGQSATIGGQ